MMNSWRPGRYQDGWNLSNWDYGAYLNSGLEEGSAKFSSGYYKEYNTPIRVKEVTFILNQFEALSLLIGYN